MTVNEPGTLCMVVTRPQSIQRILGPIPVVATNLKK